MSDLTTYLGLYVRGDAQAKVEGLERAFGGLAKRGGQHVGALSRTMGLVGTALDRLGNRYTAVITGGGAAAAAKYVGDLQERLNYMGITADKSAAEMGKFKETLFATAQAPDIRIDPSQILDAFDAIVEKTGDFDFAVANIRNIGLAIRATKADGADVGAWMSQLKEKFRIESPEGILSAIDHSINAGKAGAFAFKDLASQGERLAAAYGAMGRTGPAAAAEIDALAQTIRKGVGGPEQAATAFEAMLNTFADAEKLKKLKAVGIRVMDPQDPKRMRSAVDLYKELITKSKGDVSKLSTIFDGEAMRAFNAGIAEFKATGGLASIDQFLGVAADGATIKADAIRANAGNINASMSALATAGRQFADANLAGPVGELADAIGALKPDQVQATMRALAWGAGAVGAMIAIKKGVDAVRWTADTVRYLRGKGDGHPGGLAGAAGAAAGVAGVPGGAGPVPVVVTNWPGAGAGSGVADLTGDGKTDTPGEKTNKAKGKSLLGRVAARGAGIGAFALRNAGLIAALGLGAYDVASAAQADDSRTAWTAGGRTLGGLLGGVAGGALGSVVAPGAGTVAGGMAGATGGAAGGEALVGALYDWIKGAGSAAGTTSAKTEVESTVRLALDLPPGVTARATTASADTGLTIDLGYTV